MKGQARAAIFSSRSAAVPLHSAQMSLPANLVTIHPYFKAHAGKWDEIEAVLKDFVATTKTEKDCLFYEFTVNGDEVFCREGYVGGEGVLHHLENVGAVLGKMLTLADLTRLEFHGSAEEIDKLRGPLGHLNPSWFVLHSGIER
jgi:hypothetical protein